MNPLAGAGWGWRHRGRVIRCSARPGASPKGAGINPPPRRRVPAMPSGTANQRTRQPTPFTVAIPAVTPPLWVAATPPADRHLAAAPCEGWGGVWPRLVGVHHSRGQSSGRGAGPGCRVLAGRGGAAGPGCAWGPEAPKAGAWTLAAGTAGADTSAWPGLASAGPGRQPLQRDGTRRCRGRLGCRVGPLVGPLRPFPPPFKGFAR